VAVRVEKSRAGFFPRVPSAQESDALVDQIEADFERDGFGLCAAELSQKHSFARFIGLAVPRFSAHFTPCVEIGWRLSAESWGRGLATEGRSSQHLLRRHVLYRLQRP
jgi:RimJ/RimL family protein N-acetyltransferase